MKIRDRELSSVYAQLTSQRKPLDDSSLTRLLSAVADRWYKGADRYFKDLSRDGITRQEQFDLTKRGMSEKERDDLCAILDEGTVPMSASARNFLEALVGRAELDGSAAPLSVGLTGVKDGKLVGQAAPNVTVEAFNLSAAPAGRFFYEDTVSLGKTDEFGKFMGHLPDGKEGDWLRLRTRDAQGAEGDWVTVRVGGLAARDERNALIALDRVVLRPEEGGFALANLTDSRPLSEKNAQVQFTNLRTGENTLVTMDDLGQFPAGAKLKGEPGDRFRVALSDGRNNRDFAQGAGELQAAAAGGATTVSAEDVPDPKIASDDAYGGVAFKRFRGPLGAPSEKSVRQGSLGDCYCPAGYGGIAAMRPEQLERVIQDRGNGQYLAVFKRYDAASQKYLDLEIPLDADLPVRANGMPLYGHSSGDTSADGMELRWPLFEKAWVDFMTAEFEKKDGKFVLKKRAASASYGDIEEGTAAQIFEAVLGAKTTTHDTSGKNVDDLWAIIKRSVDSKSPAAAGTYSSDPDCRYANSGVYTDHTYSVLGYTEKDGKRYVTLRNPWGQSEPSNDNRDHVNDGVFDLPVEDFKRLFENFVTMRG